MKGYIEVAVLLVFFISTTFSRPVSMDYQLYEGHTRPRVIKSRAVDEIGVQYKDSLKTKRDTTDVKNVKLAMMTDEEIKGKEFQSLTRKVDEVHKIWSIVMQDYVKYTKNHFKQLPEVHKEITDIGNKLKRMIEPTVEKMTLNAELRTAERIIQMFNAVNGIKRELRKMEEYFSRIFSSTYHAQKEIVKKFHLLHALQIQVMQKYNNYKNFEHVKTSDINKRMRTINLEISQNIQPKINRIQSKGINEEASQINLLRSMVERSTGKMEELQDELQKIIKESAKYHMRKSVQTHQVMKSDGHTSSNGVQNGVRSQRLRKRNPKAERESKYKFDQVWNGNEHMKTSFIAITVFICGAATLVGVIIIVVVIALERKKEAKQLESEQKKRQFPFKIDESTSQIIIPIGSQV